MEKDPLKEQVGGAHYKSLPIQPIEFIADQGLNFFEGNILKYLCRYNKKNGDEDLDKAIHYCCLAVNLSIAPSKTYSKLALRMFCMVNDLDNFVYTAITHVLKGSWSGAINIINELKEQ